MAQSALQFAPDPQQDPRLSFFAGLDPLHEAFPRLAAQRVAELDNADDIEAALLEARICGAMPMVESLAAYSIGDKLYAIHQALERQQRLDALKQPLRGKVEDQLKRLHARTEALERAGKT